MLGAGSSPPSLSLAAHTLPFRALATLVGRAPLGGEREIAMACFMTARLLSGALGPAAPSATERSGRAQAARSWFAALALPAATRAPFASAADASASGDRSAMTQALGMVIEATAHVLDQAARRELEELGTRIASEKERPGVTSAGSRP